MPRYADLQHAEAAHAPEHLAHGVPDLRLATLSARYQELLRLELPLERDGIRLLRDFAPLRRAVRRTRRLRRAETIQHDDLHHANLYARGGRLRALDWGNASISHPFASLVVTFRFLDERIRLAPGNPWFARLRDAYLEHWVRTSATPSPSPSASAPIACAIAYLRQRAALRPEERRPGGRIDRVQLPVDRECATIRVLPLGVAWMPLRSNAPLVWPAVTEAWRGRS